ncbi:MAG: hypothetical protein QGI21_07060 [Candidatus Poseidoniaceae archaeon]|jgi:hypothetical protein|nr:hypothetical protein [Candidatus Poseidoniaceae archaeon]
MKRISPFLVALIFLTSIIPLSTVIATGTPTTISNFTGGYATIDISLTGGVENNSSTFDIPRNVTFESASFDIEVDAFDQSPGKVWLDTDGDGINEWEYNSLGYGDIGHQNNFYDGTSHSSVTTFGGSNAISGILLPTQASVKTSEINTSFSPQLGGGFFQTGEYQDLVKSDIDNDGLPEPIFLSQRNATNVSGSNSTGIAWIDWDQNAQSMNTSVWISTCVNASSISVGDINGDANQDIVTFDITNDLACIHIANNSGFDTPIQKTLPMGLVEGKIGDINMDGNDDIVSIHAMGVLSLSVWDNNSWNLSTPMTTTLTLPDSPMPSNLLSLEVGDFMANGNDTSLVGDITGYWQHWGFINGQLAGPLANFDSVKDNQIIHDLDSDGDMDVIGTNDQGYALLINNGTQWNGNTSMSQIDLFNSTIYDYDGDGVLDLLTPAVGFSDGSTSTIEGNISLRTINSSTVGQIESTNLEPWSMPRDIMTMDMDGDGVDEQIILAGESSYGIFIGGLHSIGLDINGDTLFEAENFGYAGDGVNGLGPLYAADQLNAISTAINSVIANQALIDGYGIMMTNLTFDVSSSGFGQFNISNLNLNYTCTFTVDSNPYTSGNLTNVLNQGMTAGVGTYTFALPFNSTDSGEISITNLQATHTPGAPNLSLPPAPNLTLFNINSQSIELEWIAEETFEESLLRYEVFRLENLNQEADLSSPYSLEMINATIDTNVTSGLTYWYQVRSVHTYGVTSPLSNKLEVTVPYPVPPSQVQNVTLVDVADDQGGSLALTWDSDSYLPGTVDHFDIYLETTSFTNISGLTLHSTITNSNSTVFTGLTNGQAYWAAVVAVDEHGNQTSEVISDGPTYPRNDLPSSIDLGLTVNAEIGYGLPFVLNLDPIIGGNSSIPSGGEISVTIYANGQSHLISSDWNGINVTDFSNLGAFTSNLHGEATIFANYSGYIGDEQNRPILGETESIQRTVYVSVEFSADKESYILDSEGESDIKVYLQTYSWNQEASGLVDGAQISWEISNLTSENESNGTSSIQNGFAQFLVNFPEGGILYVNLTNPSWLSATPSSLEIELHPYGYEAEENNTTENETEEEPWEPSTMLQVTLDCGQIQINVSMDNDIVCTMTNPNNFTVEIELEADGWSDWGDYIEFNPTSPTSFELTENESIQIDIRVDIIQDLVVAGLTNGQVEMRITQKIKSWMSVPDSTFILDNSWTIIEFETDPEEEIEQPENKDDDTQKGQESDDSLTYILAVAGVAVVGLVIFIILRIRSNDEEEWTEADLEMDEDPYDTKERISKPLPVGLALDDFDDKTVQDEAPEREESSLMKEIDGIEEEELDEYEVEYEEEDDSITVDEHGTEWYEDELGVWWYRDEGEEDWSEFVDE